MSFNPQISRRNFLAAVGVAGAGATLAACAGTGGSTSSAEGSSAEGATNTIVWWSNPVSYTHLDVYKRQNQILAKVLANKLNRARQVPGRAKRV